MDDQTLPDDATGQYLKHRKNVVQQSAIDELNAAFNTQTQPPQPPTPPPVQEGEESLLSKAGAVAKDVARGVTEVPGQIIGGVRDAAQETLELVQSIGDWADNKLPLGGFKLSDKGLEYLSSEEMKKQGVEPPKLPEGPGKAESVTGGLVRSVSQFVAGFLGAGKLLKAVKPTTTAGKTGKAMGQGAIADFTVFDPHEKKLSDLMQENPALQNPVTEFLAADPNDNEAELRFKRAAEGLALGAATEGFLVSLKALRSARIARVEAKGKLGAGEPQPAAPLFTNADMAPLGDPEGKLFTTSKPAGPAMKDAADKTAGMKPKDVGSTTAEHSDMPRTEINFARINAPEDVQKVMQQMADWYKGDVDAAKRGVRSWEQTKLSAGQQNAWKTLSERRAGEPLNAEQSLAARQLWVTSAGKLSEVAQLAATNPSEANLFNFRKMLATHYAIQKEVLAARTETARALNAWAIPAGSDAAKAKQLEFLLADSGGVEVHRDLARRVAALSNQDLAESLDKFVEGTAFAKTRAAIHQAWINGLLTNPTTHVVNAMSNVAVLGQQIYERKAANLLARAIGNQNSVELAESLAMSHGMVEGLKDAFRVLARGKGIELPPAVAQANKLEGANRGALSAETLNIGSDTALGKAMDFLDGATQIPGKALAGADTFFKSIGYRMELHAQAARMASREVNAGTIKPEELKTRIAQILDNPPQEIQLEAADAALYNTFNNAPDKAFDAVAGGVRAFNRIIPGLGHIILPFRRTPINIATYTFERTPLAPLVKAWRADVAAGGARRDLALARTATGSALLLAAIDAAMSDRITGAGPKNDPRQQQLAARMGRQKYSVKFGDKWYSYSRTDPIGTLVGLGADIADITANGNDSLSDNDLEQVIIASTLAIANNVTSKTYMQGLAQFFDAVSNGERYGQAYFNSLAGTVVPSGVAAVARQVDPYMRTAQDMVDAIKRRTPGLSDELPLYRDLWGREVDYRSPAGALYDALSPIYIKKENPEPIDSELLRLEYYPSMPDKRITYNNVPLDLESRPEIYARFVQLAGNEAKHQAWGMGAKDMLNAVISGQHPLSQVYNTYSDGPDGGKAAYIQNILNGFRDLAKRQLLEEYPELRAEYENQRQPGGGRLRPDLLGQ